MTEALVREVTVATEDADLPGLLAVPPDAAGVVLFAHGSGSSRFSRRNQAVARTLQHAGLATLLFDLLTVREDERDAVTREYRFDIARIGDRMADAVAWTASEPDLARLPLGLFGASTGAAAALVAAADHPDRVSAVVSRGGRPDLAGPALERVRAPVLLLVGGRDTPVIGMNEDAAKHMRCPHELRIVPGATHLFEEPGTLEQVRDHARAWFLRHLPGA